MHSLLETRADRTLGGEEPVQTFVHRLQLGVCLFAPGFALPLAHGRPSVGRLGISREPIRSTARSALDELGLGGERAAAVASRPCRSPPSGLTPFERASGRSPAPAAWIRLLCR